MKAELQTRRKRTTNPEPAAPGWARIPTRGTLPGCPFSRGAIYALIKQGKVRTASVPVQGNKRGIRMIWLPSLLAIVEAHATGPETGQP